MLNDFQFAGATVEILMVAAAAVVMATERISTEGPQVVAECYGDLLGLGCPVGHRIRVLRDWFGLNTEGSGSCQYVEGDCRVPNSIGASVVHRYCEGKQVCNNFQVDRRICGLNQTNYEQVEYLCIADDDVVDMCRSVHYTSSAGYLSTPNFPNVYPPNRHCLCQLHPINSTARITLDFPFFLVKYDSPCKDWIETTVDGQRRRMCGYHRISVTGNDVTVAFHSDQRSGHQGAWCRFAGDAGYVEITCNSKSGDVISSNESDNAMSQPIESANISMTSQVSLTPEVGGIDEIDYEYEQVTSYDAENPNDPTSVYDGNRVLHKETKATSILTDSHLATPGEYRRTTSNATGILVISLCVGGVLLLFFVFLTLISVIKRRAPGGAGDPGAKDHIQHQLNSLSFYDSIPLYDSVGIKATSDATLTTTDATPVNTHHRVTDSCSASVGSPGGIGSRSRENLCHRSASSLDEGPYWVTVRTPEPGTEMNVLSSTDLLDQDLASAGSPWTTVELRPTAGDEEEDEATRVLDPGAADRKLSSASSFTRDSDVYTHV